MISRTLFNVTDNSNIKCVKCIKLFKYSFLNLGALVYTVILETKNFSKLKKGTVTKAIVVRTKINFNRINGCFIYFRSNDVVLIDNKNDFYCTRIFGPLVLDLRKKQQIRLLSLAVKLI